MVEGSWAVAWVTEAWSRWAALAVQQPGTIDPGLAQLVQPDVGDAWSSLSINHAVIVRLHVHHTTLGLEPGLNLVFGALHGG